VSRSLDSVRGLDRCDAVRPPTWAAPVERAQVTRPVAYPDRSMNLSGGHRATRGSQPLPAPSSELARPQATGVERLVAAGVAPGGARRGLLRHGSENRRSARRIPGAEKKHQQFHTFMPMQRRRNEGIPQGSLRLHARAGVLLTSRLRRRGAQALIPACGRASSRNSRHLRDDPRVE
jgi:hypothetical protein